MMQSRDISVLERTPVWHRAQACVQDHKARLVAYNHCMSMPLSDIESHTYAIFLRGYSSLEAVGKCFTL